MRIRAGPSGLMSFGNDSPPLLRNTPLPNSHLWRTVPLHYFLESNPRSSHNSGLWSFLAAWRTLFDRFDADRSGYISPSEYSNALVAFGYRLSQTFVNLLYCTYDRSGDGRMSFDLFVQSCIILKRMTDVFKRYDDDRDGYITLSFEEFLTGEIILLLFLLFSGFRTGLEEDVRKDIAALLLSKIPILLTDFSPRHRDSTPKIIRPLHSPAFRESGYHFVIYESYHDPSSH